jgi:hypothetical protein
VDQQAHAAAATAMKTVKTKSPKQQREEASSGMADGGTQLCWGDVDPALAKCLEQMQALERREAALAEKWLRTDRDIPSKLGATLSAPVSPHSCPTPPLSPMT